MPQEVTIVPSGSLVTLVDVNGNPVSAGVMIPRGDGVTDQSASINAYIAASPVGSTIYFGGNHAVASTILLLPNRTYTGPIGYLNGFTFRQVSGSNLPAVLASSDWYNNATTSGYPIRLYNIEVDANSAGNASTQHGIVLMNFNSVIEDCSVINSAGNGITTSASNRANTAISNTMVENRIINCKVNGCGARGIYMKDANLNANTDWYLEGCIVSNCIGDCIAADNAAGAFVQRNHVYGGSANGYTLGNCYSTFIISNEVDGYGTGVTSGNYIYGMYLGLIGPRAVVIEGNIVSNPVEIAGAHYHHVEVHSSFVGNARAHVANNHVLGAWPSSAAESLGINYSGVVGGTLFVRDINNKFELISFNRAFDTHTGFDSLELANPAVFQWGAAAYWTSDNGLTTKASINADGNGSIVSSGGFAGGQSASAVVIATAGTITTAGLLASVINPSAAVTGIIMQAGTVPGQVCMVVNQSTFGVTFNTTPATSRVADSATLSAIPGLSHRIFVWNSLTSLWYPDQ